MATRLFWAVLAAIVLSSASAGAISVYEDEDNDRALAVGVLLQPQIQTTQNAAPNGHDYDTEFFLRRARLYVAGEVTKGLTFFFQTDQPNWGKDGDFTGAFFVQDAFMSYEVARWMTIDGGFFLVPLTHHTLEGTSTLDAIDYHSTVLPFPANMGKLFRDMGTEVRGLLFDDRIHYRAGIFEGVRGPDIPAGAPAGTLPLNADAEPRFVGQVRLNLFGVEDKFLFNGIYFSDKPMVSLGIGGDYQHHAVRIATGVADYAVVSGDVFAEVPFSARDEIIVKAYLADWQQGTGSTATGLGAFGEAGFRHLWLEPLASVERFHANQGRMDFTAIRPGVNFWLKQHNANIKVEAAWLDTTTPSAGSTRQFVATLQGQVFF